MTWYDEDFYDEPSEFEEKFDEFKNSLMKSIKEEMLAENEKLRKENDELKEIKKQKLDFEWKLKQEKARLEREKAEYKRLLKNSSIWKLFDDIKIEAWGTEFHSEYIKNKCDKCDDERKLHFKSPGGRNMTEDCPYCSQKMPKYTPCKKYLWKFNVGDNDKINNNTLKNNLYYERYDCDTYDSYRYTDVIWDLLDKEHKTYEQQFCNRSRMIFGNLEECIDFCDYVNKRLKKEKKE